MGMRAHDLNVLFGKCVLGHILCCKIELFEHCNLERLSARPEIHHRHHDDIFAVS